MGTSVWRKGDRVLRFLRILWRSRFYSKQREFVFRGTKITRWISFSVIYAKQKIAIDVRSENWHLVVVVGIAKDTVERQNLVSSCANLTIIHFNDRNYKWIIWREIISSYTALYYAWKINQWIYVPFFNSESGSSTNPREFSIIALTKGRISR